MKKIMTVHVNCFGSQSVDTGNCIKVQVLFDGTADGEYFDGTIMPGGVDTQTVYPDGSGNLSARYMLEGTDCEGQPCKMYINNDAELGSSETHPTIYTDSKALAWLNSAKLEGKITIDDTVTIEIFAE